MDPAYNLLLRSNPLSGTSGELIAVTPERAGWQYVSLVVRRMAPGERIVSSTGPDEVALVVLGGRCRVEAGGREWALGERATVFDGQPWTLYLPPRMSYRATADTPVEIAICGARAETAREPALIRPEEVEAEIRGAGNAARQINHIVRPDFPARRLLVVEVFTPSGNWSSYPPHKHDVPDMPREADLEEIYYYRISPADGFGLQRLYTGDGRIDAAYVIRDGDLVLVPEGYHAFVVAQGYTGYYLNVLAGDGARTMQSADDPAYHWVRATWRPEMTSHLRSWRDVEESVNRGAGRRE
jgi:5-deoxy-glucuronate isomerase